MKKKSLKRTGAVVLTMAMVLSVGAMSAISASAVNTYSVTIKNVKDYGYSYSKIAYLNNDGVTYTVTDAWKSIVKVDNTTQKLYIMKDENKVILSEQTTASQKQALATELAGKNVEGTAVGNTSDTVNLESGYYLFTSESSFAQPMLVEVKTADITDLVAKANEIPITKKITAITNAKTTEDAGDLVSEGGKSGLVSKGAKVEYTLETYLPNYDEELKDNNANITDFTITDIPENTLTGLTIKEVKVAGTQVAKTAGETKTWTSAAASNDALAADAAVNYFTATAKDTAGDGIKITFDDSYVLNNGGKKVEVVLEATVADAVDVNDDANVNTATVEYHHDFWTGGSRVVTHDPTTEPEFPNPDPEHPDDPWDDDTPLPPDEYNQDSAKVYATVLTVNKVDENGALKGAEFTLYSGTGNDKTEVAKLGTDGTLSTFVFKGLNVGTYTLSETKLPSTNYKQADDVVFTVTAIDFGDQFAGAYTFTNLCTDLDDNSDDEPIADATLEVFNVKGQQLPATGGIGTVLFTVGDADRKSVV